MLIHAPLLGKICRNKEVYIHSYWPTLPLENVPRFPSIQRLETHSGLAGPWGCPQTFPESQCPKEDQKAPIHTHKEVTLLGLKPRNLGNLNEPKTSGKGWNSTTFAKTCARCSPDAASLGGRLLLPGSVRQQLPELQQKLRPPQGCSCSPPPPPRPGWFNFLNLVASIQAPHAGWDTVGSLRYWWKAGQPNTRACLSWRRLEMGEMLSSGPSPRYLGSRADLRVKRGLVATRFHRWECGGTGRDGKGGRPELMLVSRFCSVCNNTTGTGRAEALEEKHKSCTKKQKSPDKWSVRKQGYYSLTRIKNTRAML